MSSLYLPEEGERNQRGRRKKGGAGESDREEGDRKGEEGERREGGRKEGERRGRVEKGGGKGKKKKMNFVPLIFTCATNILFPLLPHLLSLPHLFLRPTTNVLWHF